MAHLDRVIVPVSDITAAQAFYATVLGSSGRRGSPGRHYFDCEGAIVARFDLLAEGDGYPAEPNPDPLCPAVSDLAETLAACQAAGARSAASAPPGVGPLGRIQQRPWREESCYASDPFANSLCSGSRSTVFTGS